MRRTSRPVLFMLALAYLASAGPASAQIGIAAQAFAFPVYKMHYEVAFDSTNQVYLVLHDAPVTGRFVDANGNPLGTGFVISAEGSDCAWATVSFGDPGGNPLFLVTYILPDGAANPKYGRFVKYTTTGPVVGAPFYITDVRGEWDLSWDSRSVWGGQQFIVSTRVNHGGYPDTQLHHVSAAGIVSGGTFIGSPTLDASAHSSLACSRSGVCMAFGFGWGANTALGGASWGRVFSAATLAPISPYFQTDSNRGLLDGQQVAFNEKVQRFHTVQIRNRSAADLLAVDTTGAYGPLDYSRSLVDPGQMGMTALAYNLATGTSLLCTKYHTSPADEYSLFGFELDDAGYVSNTANRVHITPWDGRVPDYYDNVAADSTNGRWLSVTSLAAGGWATLVQGTLSSTTPCSSYSLAPTSASPTADAGSIAVTVTGLPAGCSGSWTAAGNGSWLSVVPASGSGSGAVTVSWSANAAAASRSDGVTIAGGQFTVSQAGTQGTTPTLTGILPSQRRARTGPFTLAVGGTNFRDGATVMWNGSERPTRWRSASLLEAAISANDLRVPGVFAVTVYSPSTGTTSNAGWFQVTGAWQIVGLGSFNRDGMADLAWQSDTGWVATWLMRGAKQIEPVLLAPTPAAVDGYRLATVADLNGDGSHDLIWQNADGWVFAWLMNGTNKASEAAIYQNECSQNGWRIVGAGDLTGDGNDDLIWQDDLGYVAVWVMNGTTCLNYLLLSPQPVAAGGWQIGGTGDFNADGMSDIVWQSADGFVAVWLMDRMTPMTNSLLYPYAVAVDGWNIAGVGDLDASGGADIIWHHQDGWLAAWFMNGATQAYNTLLTPDRVQ